MERGVVFHLHSLLYFLNSSPSGAIDLVQDLVIFSTVNPGGSSYSIAWHP